MNRMRLLILVAAILAALLAAYLSTGLLRRPAPQVVQPQVQKSESVDVLVAGTAFAPGQRFGSTGLQWRAWPRDGLAADMITRETMPDAPTQMRDARARVSMIAGEPVLPGKIVKAGEAGFLSSVLPEGMRAVAISITEISSVSGFVLPNDRVDVILTRTTTDSLGNKISTGEAVITNAKVLAINQTLGGGTTDATVPEGRTAVLELNPKQAEVLAKVAASGEISLALRALADGGDGKPVLADNYRNPSRATSGPLIIRYGLEHGASGQ